MTTNPNAPTDYPTIVSALVKEVRDSQMRVYVTANHELVMLCWTIGRAILDNEDAHTDYLEDRLAYDLREAFPHMELFKPKHLFHMRELAHTWPAEFDFERSAASRLPWDHLVLLLDLLDNSADRASFADLTLQHGWSRETLRKELEAQFRS